jgi:hypothetical protein
MHRKFYPENLRGRNSLGKLDVEGREILRKDLEKGVCEAVCWIHLTYERTLTNTVMNFRVP